MEHARTLHLALKSELIFRNHTCELTLNFQFFILKNEIPAVLICMRLSKETLTYDLADRPTMKKVLLLVEG